MSSVDHLLEGAYAGRLSCYIALKCMQKELWYETLPWQADTGDCNYNTDWGLPAFQYAQWHLFVAAVQFPDESMLSLADRAWRKMLIYGKNLL